MAAALDRQTFLSASLAFLLFSYGVESVTIFANVTSGGATVSGRNLVFEIS